jgi:hypothetical protein
VDQKWFEMPEIRKRRLETAVWIPLRSSDRRTKDREYGDLGHLSEFYGVGTLAVLVGDKATASKLDWQSLGLTLDHSGSVERGDYVPSDIRPRQYDGFEGAYLVLDQRGNSEEHHEWHLHQDLAITLGLKREGDVWVSLDEGYIEVARLERDEEGSPRLLAVRSSHLRDYLCARGMALYVTSYRQRREIVEDAGHITWPANPHEQLTETDRWEGRVSEIHEGGMPYGEVMGVFHVSRTDVDPEEDVPTMLGRPTEAEVRSSRWTKRYEGRKLFVVEGQLWRREWLDPAPASPIVRRDKTPATVFFITDAAGTQETRDTLAQGGRWLWFRPEVVASLAHRRGGSLGWFTRDTGSVACSPGDAVHFGINPLGLVNAYAKDIALLPDWQQRIWAGYNVPPDGGISDELLASHARAEPADTQAPERYLAEGIETLGRLLQDKAGVAAFRPHRDIPDVLRRAHRFRAVDRQGLLSLAKDLARVTADSLDAAAIRSGLKRADPKLGSLKSLESLLATQVGAERAREVMRPLFGVYELRLADAHLPKRELDETLEKVGVDQAAPHVVQGYQLLSACVGAIFEIIEIVDGWREEP